MSNYAGVASTEVAMQLFREGKFHECIECVEKLVEKQSEDAQAYTVLGAAYSQVGDRAMAIGAFERALSEDGTPRAHYNLGKAYEQSGRTKDAMDQYRLAMEAEPGYKQAVDAFKRVGEMLGISTEPAQDRFEPGFGPAFTGSSVNPASAAVAPPPGAAVQATTHVPPRLKTREEKEAEQEIEIKRVQKMMTKSGLIYGVLVGPVGVMGAMFLLRVFPLTVGTIILTGVLGVVLGAIVGLWTGYSSGDESSGWRTGALAGAVIIGILRLFGGEFTAIDLMISAASGAMIGGISGYFIGMMVSNSIGWN